MTHDFMPFVMAVGAGMNAKVKMNTSRIIEALIIAVVSGGLSMYGTVTALGAKLEALEQNQQRLEYRIDKMHDDLYTPSGKRDAWGWPNSPKAKDR